MFKLKQYDIIDKLNTIFIKQEEINSVVLIGSFAKDNPSNTSDIDYQIVIYNNFNYMILLKTLKEEFEDRLNYYIYLEEKNKLSLYMDSSSIVVEIMIYNEETQLDKYFITSEIKDINNSIILNRDNKLYDYLMGITKEYNKNIEKLKIEKISYLIVEFQSRFEALSREHYNSDGYKYNVLYSHALNALVRIIYLCESDGKYEYMPKNFLTDYSYPLELNIEELATMDLKKVNKHKRILLNLFTKYLSISIEKFSLKIEKVNIINFLENIYKRDFFWNFRDMSKFNNRLEEKFIYRTTALCLIEEKELLIIELSSKNITTIVDLRADIELEEFDYSEEFKNSFNVVHAPFDPWAQSVEFKNMHNSGTNIEIAYKFFSYECKDSIKKVILSILEANGSVAIHCHAGKDRTGIFFTILHLLIDAPKEIIYLDYLASKMDTKKEYIDIFLEIVEEKGGIVNYLKSCNLSKVEIDTLRKKVSVIC